MTGSRAERPARAHNEARRDLRPGGTFGPARPRRPGKTDPTREGTAHARSCRQPVQSAPHHRGATDPLAGTRAGARAARGVRAVSHRHPRHRRRLAGQTDPPVRSRSRRRGDRGASRRRGDLAHAGTTRRAAVARPRLRRVPLLRRRPGEPVRAAVQHRLLRRRRLRRVRARRRPVRGAGPRRCLSDRRSAAVLRRRDDLRGGQSGPRRAGRACRRLRHRRPWPPRGAVRPAGRRASRRRRCGHRQARTRGRARGRPRDRRAGCRPCHRPPPSGRGRRGHRARGGPRRLRSGLPFAEPRRPPRAGLAPRGRDAHRPGVRHRAQGDLDHRIHRRHPAGSRRGVRPPCRRSHTRHRVAVRHPRRQPGGRERTGRRGSGPGGLRLRLGPARRGGEQNAAGSHDVE